MRILGDSMAIVLILESMGPCLPVSVPPLAPSRVGVGLPCACAGTLLHLQMVSSPEPRPLNLNPKR